MYLAQVEIFSFFYEIDATILKLGELTHTKKTMIPVFLKIQNLTTQVRVMGAAPFKKAPCPLGDAPF